MHLPLNAVSLDDGAEARQNDLGGVRMRLGLAFTTVALIGLAVSASAQDAKVQQGMKLFVDQKCSLCHSVAGKGNAKGALDNVGAKDSADELRQWLADSKGMTAKTKSTRKPEMKQYTLSKEDTDALVAYLQTLKTK